MNWNSRKATLLCLSVFLTMSPVACSSSSDSPTDPGPGDSNVIAVRDNFFDPASTSVGPGDSVTWTWQGSDGHNVTWQSADLPNAPTQSSGSHSVTMPSSTGSFPYECTIHAGMRGTIRVE